MGTTVVTGSYGRSRHMSSQSVLVDLDYGSLQIGRAGELCKLIHGDNNVGAWCLVDFLVAAHIECIS
jgi:hypothetical protein